MKNLFAIAIALLSMLRLSAQPLPTANDFASFRPYTGTYDFGINPGYYGSKWSTQQIIDLGSGNGSYMKGLGVKSYRMKLADWFLTQYGFTSLIPDYEYLKTKGVTEITAFVGEPAPANVWDTSFFYYVTNGDTVRPRTKIFKGLHEPIWLDAEKTTINPKNTYASYLYRTVRTYGKYVKFWEIVNEPDFTYGSGGWLADADPTNPTTWFYRDPTPEELYNLHAPVQYYVRLLRVSWDVIKTVQPDGYVCTGGIGNRSFLAALLRNTDNPDGGKVTAEFPLKGGAYFDVLSFHTYPEFSTLVKYWKDKVGTVYERHSDRLTDGHLLIKSWMDSLLVRDGYNGVTRPKKHFICTETGTSRVMDGGNVGGNELQKNYMLKAHVKTMMDGQIKQTYWFTTGDGATNQHWDLFGCYYYFGNNTPLNASPTDQGIALKTLSDLVHGKTFDALKTQALHLPPSVDGGAFTDGSGKCVYVLWAKTTVDMQEAASAVYSFPSVGQYIRKEWNYSQSNQSSTINGGAVPLTQTPSFFEINTLSLPVSLLSFTAQAQGQKVITAWQVAGERNFSRYEVERSATALNFSSIGKVSASGATAYQFTDPHPLPGANYYRLRLVDQDGSATYSKVVVVSFSKTKLHFRAVDVNGRVRAAEDREDVLLRRLERGHLYFIESYEDRLRVGVKKYIKTVE